MILPNKMLHRTAIPLCSIAVMSLKHTINRLNIMIILFRYSLYFFVSISALVSISSCVTYGPDTENKSAADIFNRKNYEGGMVLFVPVLKSKKGDTIIEGTVYVTDYRLILPRKSGHLI